MKRVLILAGSDPRGSLYFLAKHLRSAGVADARLVVLGEVGDLAWQDLAELRDGGQELRDLLARAEILHLVDAKPPDLDLFDNLLARRLDEPNPPRVIVQHGGCGSLASQRQLSVLARERAWPVLTTEVQDRALGLFIPPYTPTHCALWTPRLPGWRLRDRVARGTVFTASRVPFRTIAGFEQLVERIDQLNLEQTGVQAEFLVTRSYRRWLQRQRLAHLAVVHYRPGDSCSVLDALVQGIPVIADVPHATQAAWAEFAEGELPPVLPTGSLAAAMQSLEPDEPSATCRLWACSMLQPDRWLRLCDRLYAGATLEEAATALKNRERAA